MALKAIIDKIEDAPEALRDHYQPGTADVGGEGKFVLKVEPVGGWSLEDVGGLKSALGKERNDRAELEKTVVKFKDLDPEKARAALAELEEYKKIDPTKEADKIVSTKFEAAKAQLLETHNTEISARDTRIKGLTDTVDNLTRKAAATAAIAGAKGSVDLLLPHVLNNSRTVEKDGKWVVEIVKDGVVQIDGKGDPITIEAFVGQMRETEAFARAFDGEGHTGGGKKPDQLGGKADPGGSRDERAKHYAQKLGVPLR